MRVLMTADPVGGVWTYAMELAAALAPHGVEIALATMGAPLDGAQREEVGRQRNIELYESRYRLEWMDDPWEDLDRAGDWLLGLAERVRPDLVHLNGYIHASLPWGVPVLVVGHSCVLSWWRAVRGEAAPATWDWYQAGVARGLAAADLVLTPTAALLEALREHYGPLAAARVVPNGRDPARFDATPAAAREPIILGAGRIWDEAKNLSALAALAPLLPWPIYLAGDAVPPGGGAAGGSASGSLAAGNSAGRAQTIRRDLPGAGSSAADPAGGTSIDQIHYLGRLPGPALATWLGRAALYALPARYEPFGLSALEAGLSGCALVLGDIPSLREVWGDAATFVPPDDAGALRQAIEWLIHDEKARSRSAERARNRALEYGPERLGREYRAAYDDVLDQPLVAKSVSAPLNIPAAPPTAAQREAPCAS